MPKQIVFGAYTNEYRWKVPKGIDLLDEETYEYYNRYDTLYIRNKKTGEEVQIEGQEYADGKRCESWDVQTCDGEDSEESTDNYAECCFCNKEFDKGEPSFMAGDYCVCKKCFDGWTVQQKAE